jgi:3-methyladenine DNA glycosylase AlkD
MAARPRPAAASKGNGVAQVLAWLEKKGTREVRDGMARFAIPSARAFGVSVGALRAYAKELGQDHALALGLWSSGWYEARLLAAFVGDPAALGAQQMNAWAKDFDNWAVCDTVCFALFDRTPLAWGRLEPWAGARAEFHKRGAFALLWSLSVHDKQAADERFIEHLPLIEAAATDERDYVKKGVDMALRAVGKRSAPLHAAALELAARLCESESASAAWIGRSTQRELSKIRPRSSKKKVGKPAAARAARPARR